MRNTLLAGLLTIFVLSILTSGIALAQADGTHGKPLNPKSTVIVDYAEAFNAKGGIKGPPVGNDDPPPPDDTHLTGHFDLIGGFWPDAIGATAEVDPMLTFIVDLRGFPAGSDTAVNNSFAVWEVVTKGTLVNALVYQDTSVVIGDGVNTYSMRNLGNAGILAATFITWDDANNDGDISSGEEYLEMDIVHNVNAKWANAPTNAKGKWWDVWNIGTHEVGHAYNLAHPGKAHDLDKEQTMFATAPAKETKKRSPEPTGDTLGMQVMYDAP